MVSGILNSIYKILLRNGLIIMFDLNSSGIEMDLGLMAPPILFKVDSILLIQDGQLKSSLRNIVFFSDFMEFVFLMMIILWQLIADAVGRSCLNSFIQTVNIYDITHVSIHGLTTCRNAFTLIAGCRNGLLMELGNFIFDFFRK